MNNKNYWKIRKIIINIMFRIKRFFFKVAKNIDSETGNISFLSTVFKYTLLSIIRPVLFVFVMWKVEDLLFNSFAIESIDTSMFFDAVIGGIGVAGVILGLYCANISSIYSTKYSDAPEIISRAFQNDRLTKKCIGSLIEYIVFGLILIAEIVVFKPHISWITVTITIMWSIMVIISYSLTGNRTYRLSDIYSVADDTFRGLYKTINKDLKSKTLSCDINFQNYYQNKAEKDICLLETINIYGFKVETNDNSSLFGFMGQNIALISSYWDIKTTIGKDSLWFKNEGKYQKWHFTSSTEVELALNTGTALNPKNVHNYLWFEDRLFEMNKQCLKELATRRDYLMIYKYIRLLDQIIDNAIKANEMSYFIKQLELIGSLLKNEIKASSNIEEKRNVAGIVEALSVVYLGILIKVNNHYQAMNFNNIINEISEALDLGKDINRSTVLRGRNYVDAYKKIAFEILAEGKRITPDWALKELVAKEEYTYLNSLLDSIRDGLDTLFTLGKELADDSGRLFDACIILSRFYEYESKYSRFKDTISTAISNFEAMHFDNEDKWGESKLINLDETISQWRKEIPNLLGKCSSSFAVETWDNRDEYPDFFGECYNHICEDAIDAIINNDTSQFTLDFESLTKLMLLYQEYIRTDFIKNKDLYRVEYAYYMVTSPIVEWAQIGSLGILWGEFFHDERWSKIVKNTISIVIKDKDEKSIKLAEKIVEYAQNRDKFIFGIGARGVLETSWNMQIEHAVKENSSYETENYIYGVKLKTDSKLLKAFCANFPDFGFSSNTAEVLWVTCINPLLPEEKQYRTSSSWEDRLNDK